jgi:hypothetical protein
MITWISIGLLSVCFFIPAWTKLRPSKENWFKGRRKPEKYKIPDVRSKELFVKIGIIVSRLTSV